MRGELQGSTQTKSLPLRVQKTKVEKQSLKSKSTFKLRLPSVNEALEPLNLVKAIYRSGRHNVLNLVVFYS